MSYRAFVPPGGCGAVERDPRVSAASAVLFRPLEPARPVQVTWWQRLWSVLLIIALLLVVIVSFAGGALLLALGLKAIGLLSWFPACAVLYGVGWGWLAGHLAW